MRVITAPEEYKRREDDIIVFLAGGITNCRDWQNIVIEKLKTTCEYFNNDADDLVIMNPRRENFPIDDPKASYEQIYWEYNRLNDADIFSMYFCSGDSDQPICMYELGRNVYRLQMYDNYDDRIIIMVERGYKREQDVKIQVGLAACDNDLVMVEEPEDAPTIHAYNIYDSYRRIKERKKGWDIFDD